MNTNRKIAIIAGALFIIADVATFTGDALLPALTGADYLIQLSAHADLVAAGLLAKIVSTFAGVGIAIAMYPIMKRANAGLALGSVVFRTLEAAFYMVGIVSLLALLKLSQQFAAAGVADRASLQAIGDSLVSVRLWAAPLLGVFAFCVGSFMYNYLFFQSRLIPRWLSGFGIAAITSLTIACMLSLFSGNRITSYIPLASPIFVQELVLAVWLIVKGFNPTLAPVPSVKPATNALINVA
ncbi:MAG TPA: DUF4386 domain-containing protein [Anaerolinea sp.]|nr:DUF4386 domain-containing protein [Anaerolinea sp.]